MADVHLLRCSSAYTIMLTSHTGMCSTRCANALLLNLPSCPLRRHCSPKAIRGHTHFPHFIVGIDNDSLVASSSATFQFDVTVFHCV